MHLTHLQLSTDAGLSGSGAQAGKVKPPLSEEGGLPVCPSAVVTPAPALTGAGLSVCPSAAGGAHAPSDGGVHPVTGRASGHEGSGINRSLASMEPVAPR
jgi:hypothetical protein